jgi:hypothetical protein
MIPGPRSTALTLLVVAVLITHTAIAQDSTLTPAQKAKIKAMQEGHELGMALNDYPASVRDARQFFRYTDVYRNDIRWQDYYYRVYLTRTYMQQCNARLVSLSVGELERELRRARSLQAHFDGKAKFYAEKAANLEGVLYHMIDYMGYYLEWLKRADPKVTPFAGTDLVPNEVTGIQVHPTIMIADLVYTIGTRVAEGFVNSERRRLYLQIMNTRMTEIDGYITLLRTARDSSADLATRYKAYGDSIEKSIRYARANFDAKACAKRCKPPVPQSTARTAPPRKPPVLKVWAGRQPDS